jgi:hypothetical protein
VTPRLLDSGNDVLAHKEGRVDIASREGHT